MISLDTGCGSQDFHLSALRAVFDSSVRRNPDKQNRSDRFQLPAGAFGKRCKEVNITHMLSIAVPSLKHLPYISNYL